MAVMRVDSNATWACGRAREERPIVRPGLLRASAQSVATNPAKSMGARSGRWPSIRPNHANGYRSGRNKLRATIHDPAYTSQPCPAFSVPSPPCSLLACACACAWRWRCRPKPLATSPPKRPRYSRNGKPRVSPSPLLPSATSARSSWSIAWKLPIRRCATASPSRRFRLGCAASNSMPMHCARSGSACSRNWRTRTPKASASHSPRWCCPKSRAPTACKRG